MRGIETSVRKIRHQVFAEVARLAFELGENTDLNGAIEAIPYKITPDDKPLYRDSIYRERAIAAERVRLAMGMSLRPENKPVHVTSGLSASNISDKYYEPPLMQVIPSACDMCEHNVYEVSDQCHGCVAHPCMEVCPKQAISMVNGKAHIDREKCIKCGKCKAICPYDAIAHKMRPCASACGISAIGSDDQGRAKIDNDKCVSCGQCMVACPFGAIADKSQIFQLIRAIQKGDEVVAEVAPAIIGQFGPNVRLWKIKAALLELGFKEVYETALGADIGAITEAHHYVNEVKTGKLPFLLTSCCPSWSMLAKETLPEDVIETVSSALTPMVATARSIKQKRPNARVVFVGPCASKKLEASRTTIRSDVDFVITFEELSAMLDAKGIKFDELEEVPVHDATGAGRGYGVAGGVAKAIEDCINEYYPETEVLIEHAEGLDNLKKILMLAKAGKKDGCLIEGMACPGGCVAGAGTCIQVSQGASAVRKFVSDSTTKLPAKDLEKIDLP